MEINYNNPETGNKFTLNTNKSFIFIYGKNGSGKTTFSKSDCFDSEFVFNVDYVNKNIYTVNESGACQTSTNRNNFSNLWIGEEIVKQEKIVEKYKKEYDDYSTKLNDLKTSIQNELQRNLVNIPINYSEYTDDDYLIDCDKISEEYEKYTCDMLETDIVDDEALSTMVKSVKLDTNLSLMLTSINTNENLKKFSDGNFDSLKSINDLITVLKNESVECEKIKEQLSNDSVEYNEGLITMIKSWLHIHETREKCLFCEHDNIIKAKEKWNSIINNKYNEDKEKTVKFIQNIIADIGILTTKKDIYIEVAPKFMESIILIEESLKNVLENVKNDTFIVMDMPKIGGKGEIKPLEKKIIAIKNYILNKNIKKLRFLLILTNNLSNKIKQEKEKLTTLMDNYGKEYETGINKVCKKLGLNKIIKFSVNKRTTPYTYEFKLQNVSDIKTLSDGQRHILAFGMFISSLENKDLSNKCIVMDDPVVSLDVIGYQNVRNVIAELTKKFDEETTKLIILTHDINYLYIQLSNIFDNPDMSLITEVYKFCDTKFKPVSLEILNADDITLYKFGIKKAKYINDVKALATLNCKLFRILIDLKARFQGTPISSNVDVEAILIDEDKKAKLREISNYFSKVYKKPDIIDAELMESFNKINETCSLLELYELISQEELDNISSIISKNEFGENDSEVFDIINQVSKFIRTTTNMNLRNYISHPRNYFTKNIVTLSLDNEL